VTLAFWLHHHSLLFNIAVDGKALGDSVGGMLLPSGMRKTFGSAFALIMVALFTVAPTSPATAYPGGIHLHIAGKVGQKAVGSTVIFGAEGLTEAPQYPTSILAPNACLWLVQANKYGHLGYPLEPKISGWGPCEGTIGGESGKTIQIPASGSLADQIPLPDLPAGKYQMWFGAWPATTVGTNSISLGVAFTIGADGTFTAIGPACGINDDACIPIPLPHNAL
jgi:hypothetical protein